MIPASGTVTASAAETGPPTLNSSRLPSVLTPVSFRLPGQARPSSVFADSGEDHLIEHHAAVSGGVPLRRTRAGRIEVNLMPHVEFVERGEVEADAFCGPLELSLPAGSAAVRHRRREISCTASGSPGNASRTAFI